MADAKRDIKTYSKNSEAKGKQGEDSEITLRPFTSSDIVLACVQLQYPPQSWLGRTSSTFSDLSLNVRNIYPSVCGDDNQKSEFTYILQIRSVNGESIFATIQRHPSVIAAEKWITMEGDMLVHVKCIYENISNAMFQSDAIPKFPFIVKKAETVWELTTPRHRVNKLLESFDHECVKYRVISIESFRERSEVKTLTKQQQAIFNIALNTGFFKIPRRIRLTDLAKKIGVAPSSLSCILRRMTQKLGNLV